MNLPKDPFHGGILPNKQTSSVLYLEGPNHISLSLDFRNLACFKLFRVLGSSPIKEEDRFESIATEDLWLNEFNWNSIDLDEATAGLAVSDRHRRLLPTKTSPSFHDLADFLTDLVSL